MNRNWPVLGDRYSISFRVHGSAEESSPEELSPLAVLRRFASVKAAGKPVEKCELCSASLPADHPHLVELRTRRLICCCRPCGVLFSSGRSAVYRRVPEEVKSLPGLRLSDVQWENLGIPVNLAFFYSPEEHKGVGNLNVSVSAPEMTPDPFSAPEMTPDPFSAPEMTPDPFSAPFTAEDDAGRIIAVYPSPAGPIESLLGLEAWQTIVEDNPFLRDLEPEVEALLVNRLSGKHLQYIVPIDDCYRLSGLIRLRWRGLSGGSEVWEEVGRYFDRLKEKACSI